MNSDSAQAQRDMSKVEMAKCADRYCGTVTRMKTLRNDEKNEDASQRSRPLVGARIASGFTTDGTGGKLYAPERGKRMARHAGGSSLGGDVEEDGGLDTGEVRGLEMKSAEGNRRGPRQANACRNRP